jgi:precorrin-2 dehydrogenase/sirohydrochlorin ferrochelatase
MSGGGRGQVGRRKIATLASCGAEEILVLDLCPLGPESAAILKHPCVRLNSGPLRRPIWTAASWSSPHQRQDTNWRISRLCAERGIPCNIVDQPEKCSSSSRRCSPGAI